LQAAIGEKWLFFWPANFVALFETGAASPAAGGEAIVAIVEPWALLGAL
jgi:hypothetical protein